MLTIGEYAVDTSVQLGNGCQGKIVRAVHLGTNTECVGKVTPFYSKNKQEQFINESQMLTKLAKCNWVVNIHHSSILKDGGVVIMEKMDTDLMTLVEENKLSLSEKAHIFEQICMGVKYLHNHNIVHLDIKPENVLLSSDYSKVKLCDFGTARCLSYVNHVPGTTQYLAPEALPFEDMVSGKKLDIWSLGILYHVLYTRTWPYVETEQAAIRAALENGEINLHPSLNSAQVEMISKLLDFNPQKRPNMNWIVKHVKTRREKRPAYLTFLRKTFGTV